MAAHNGNKWFMARPVVAAVRPRPAVPSFLSLLFPDNYRDINLRSYGTAETAVFGTALGSGRARRSKSLWLMQLKVSDKGRKNWLRLPFGPQVERLQIDREISHSRRGSFVGLLSDQKSVLFKKALPLSLTH